MEAVAWTAITLLAVAVFGSFAGLLLLGNRIDAQGSDLGRRLEAQGADLGRRIDSLGARIDALSGRMDQHLERHPG